VLNAADAVPKVCAMMTFASWGADMVEEAVGIESSLLSADLVLNRFADEGLHGLSPCSLTICRRASLSTPHSFTVSLAQEISFACLCGVHTEKALTKDCLPPRFQEIMMQGTLYSTPWDYWDDPLTNKQKLERIAMMRAQNIEKAVGKLETVATNADQLKEQCSSLQAEVKRLTEERRQQFEQAYSIEAGTEVRRVLFASTDDMQNQQLISLCSSLYIGSLMRRVVIRKTLSLNAFHTQFGSDASDQQSKMVTMKAELQHAHAAFETERVKIVDSRARSEMMKAGEEQDSLLPECAMFHAEALTSSFRQAEKQRLHQHKVAPRDSPHHDLHELVPQLEADLHEVQHKSLQQQEDAHQERLQLYTEVDAWHKSSAHLEVQLRDTERKMSQQQVEAHQREAQLHEEVGEWHESSVKLEAQLHEAQRSLLETHKDARQRAARLRAWRKSSAKLEADLQEMKILLLQHQEQTHDETARFLLEQKAMLGEASSYKEELMEQLTISEHTCGKLQALEAFEASISLEYAAAQEQALGPSSAVKDHAPHLEKNQIVLSELADLEALHEEARQNEIILANEDDLANSENSALCTSLQRKAAIIQDLRDSIAKRAMQLASCQQELAHVKAQEEAVSFEIEGHKEKLASHEELLCNAWDASRMLEEKTAPLQIEHLLAQQREVNVATEQVLANSENCALRASVQHSAAMLQETYDSKMQLAQQLMCCQQELASVKGFCSTAVSESESACMQKADLEGALKAQQEAARQEYAAEMVQEAARKDISVAFVPPSPCRRWTVWLLRIVLQVLALAVWTLLKDELCLNLGFAGHRPVPAEANGMHGQLLIIQRDEEENEAAGNVESSTVRTQLQIAEKSKDFFVKSASEASRTAAEQPDQDDQKTAPQMGHSLWITPRRACQFVASTSAIVMTAFIRHVV